jgi:ornithine--oxo-acid transaminase
MGQGLLCKDTRGDVIRLAPPLVITKQEIDWALERLEAVL